MENSTASSSDLQKQIRKSKIEYCMKMKLEQYIQYYRFRQKQIQDQNENMSKQHQNEQIELTEKQQIYQLITFHQNDMKNHYVSHYGNYAISLYYQKTNKMRLINQLVRTKFNQQKKSKEQITKFVFHLYFKFLRIQMDTDYKSSNLIISLKYMNGFKPYKKINQKIIKKLFMNEDFKETFQTFVHQYLDIVLVQQKEYQIQKLFHRLQLTPDYQIAKQLDGYKLHFPWKQTLIQKTIDLAYEMLKQNS